MHESAHLVLPGETFLFLHGFLVFLAWWVWVVTFRVRDSRDSKQVVRWVGDAGKVGDKRSVVGDKTRAFGVYPRGRCFFL